MAQDELRTVTHFVDFLDKALNLNPDKRLSVKEALVHPFVYGKMGRVGDVNGSGSGSGGAQGKK